MKILSTLFVLLASTICLRSEILHVPASYATIQAAVDAGSPGDTVLVAPGEYQENIHFQGVDLVLASQFIFSGDEAIIETTIVDGGGNGPVVTLDQGESRNTVIVGLTIKNGASIAGDVFQNLYGGGIMCLGASPTIRYNIITDCTSTQFNYSDFGGIYCVESSALIENTMISDIMGFFVQNTGAVVCTNSNIEIRNNRFTAIHGGYAFFGGGISASESTLLIERNIIDSCAFDVVPLTASIKLNNCNATIINNTLIGELAMDYHCNVSLVNNILQPGMSQFGPMSPIITEMDSSTSVIEALAYNVYPDAPDENGNLDADPLFVNAALGDYHLQAASPCVDAGDPSAQHDPDGTVADIGAYYYDQNSSAVRIVEAVPLLLFPNPAGEFISVSDYSPGQLYRVVSADGRIICGGFMDSNQVEVGSLSGGLYFIELLGGDGLRTGRFVKR